MMPLFTSQTLPNGLIVATCLECSVITASPQADVLRIAERCHKCSHAGIGISAPGLSSRGEMSRFEQKRSQRNFSEMPPDSDRAH